jgi:hypothetical protein
MGCPNEKTNFEQEIAVNLCFSVGAGVFIRII